MQQLQRRPHRDGGVSRYKMFAQQRHWHGRILFRNKVVWETVRVDGRMKWVSVGHLCPVCGFHPNDTAKDMTRQALEACGR